MAEAVDFDGLVNGILEAIEPINQMAEATQSLKETMENTAEPVSTVTDVLGSGLLVALTDLVPLLVQAAVPVAQLVGGFTQLPEGVGLAIEVFMGLFEVLTPLLVLLEALVPLAATLGISVGALAGIILGVIAAIAALIAIGVTLYNNWEEIKTFLSGTWNAIKETAATTWEAIKGNLIAVWDTIVQYFSELPGKILEFFNELPGKLGYALGFALGSLIQFGLDAISWAQDTVPTIIDNIVNFFTELPGKIASWLTETYNKIFSWGVSLLQWATKEIPKVIDKIVDFFNKLPGKMLEIGTNIIKSLWDGINSMIDWLKDKVNDFIDGLVGGIKDALDMHSPSKVFADIGENMALGLIEGLKNQRIAVETMLTKIVFPSGTSTTNYNSGGNNIYVTVQDGEDLLRTLRRMGVAMP